MRAARIAAIIVAALTLDGCATTYHEMGLSGVAAEQMTADTWRIRARGNAVTSRAQIQDYVLLKAAETTEAAGATHFQIISEADAGSGTTVVPRRTADPSGLELQQQRVARRTLRTGAGLIEPGEDAYIRVLKLAPGQQPSGAGVFSAAEIIQFVGARVKRASE
jgi:hypothetical protein